MLKQFCESWNRVYKDHKAKHHIGSVTIEEKGKQAKNKSLTLNCGEAVSFPAKQFDGYDMFNALTNSNCDGAFLVTNDEGTYDLVHKRCSRPSAKLRKPGLSLSHYSKW